MSGAGFALFCLVGFLLPALLLAWLDRPRGRKTGPRAPHSPG